MPVPNRQLPVLSEEALAVLGLSIPPAIQDILEEAARNYSNPDKARSLLQTATRMDPEHPAVMIACYRFFFYQGDLRAARDMADLCLAKALFEIGVRDGWRQAKPTAADFSDWGAVIPRFFLFSLKGWAYLSMRLGELDAGREAVTKLLELDPLDRIGAGTLLGVLERGGRDEDE
jgi:hypothetical protein